MSFLYHRVETKDEVHISFKNYYLWHLNLIALVVMSFVKPSSELGFIVVIFVFLLLLSFFLYQFMLRMKASAEIRKAMKNGPVQVTGSVFSNKRPLTYTIKK